MIDQILPPDATLEEIHFVEEIKRQMIYKLGHDRTRFVFLYCIELGKKQREAADVLGVHETEISRQLRYIRKRLTPFREGYTKL